MSGNSTSKLQRTGGHTTTATSVTPPRTTPSTTTKQAKTGMKGEGVVFWGYTAFIYVEENQEFENSCVDFSPL